MSGYNKNREYSRRPPYVSEEELEAKLQLELEGLQPFLSRMFRYLKETNGELEFRRKWGNIEAYLEVIENKKRFKNHGMAYLQGYLTEIYYMMRHAPVIPWNWKPKRIYQLPPPAPFQYMEYENLQSFLQFKNYDEQQSQIQCEPHYPSLNPVQQPPFHPEPRPPFHTEPYPPFHPELQPSFHSPQHHRFHPEPYPPFHFEQHPPFYFEQHPRFHSEPFPSFHSPQHPRFHPEPLLYFHHGPGPYPNFHPEPFPYFSSPHPPRFHFEPHPPPFHPEPYPYFRSGPGPHPHFHPAQDPNFVSVTPHWEHPFNMPPQQMQHIQRHPYRHQRYSQESFGIGFDRAPSRPYDLAMLPPPARIYTPPQRPQPINPLLQQQHSQKPRRQHHRKQNKSKPKNLLPKPQPPQLLELELTLADFPPLTSSGGPCTTGNQAQNSGGGRHNRKSKKKT